MTLATEKLIPTHETLALCDVELTSETLGDNPPRRRFRMEAYSGSTFERGYGCAVIDLEGLELPADGSVPIFLNHDPNKFIGRSDMNGVTFDAEVKHLPNEQESFRKGLRVAGTLFDGVQAAAEAAAISDQGGRYQASVGIAIDAEAIEFLGAEDSATVNDRDIAGPCIVFRKTQLREVSFVPIGADHDTSAIALSGHQQEASVMPADTTVDPIAEERARIRSINESFAHDPNFAMKASGKGWSLVEAKAAYSEVLADKIKANEAAADKRDAEWQEKLTAAEATQTAPQGKGLAEQMGGSSGTVTTPKSDDPVVHWNEMLAAEIAGIETEGVATAAKSNLTLSARGQAKQLAVRTLVTREPEAYKSYLAAYNDRGLGRRRQIK